MNIILWLLLHSPSSLLRCSFMLITFEALAIADDISQVLFHLSFSFAEFGIIQTNNTIHQCVENMSIFFKHIWHP